MNVTIHRIATSRPIEMVSNLLHAAVAMPFGYAFMIVFAHIAHLTANVS